VVLVQTCFAPKTIMAIAYDSGGVTTSTVTVPIVAALGLGLAAAMVPGRNPAIDGFGLIAFASLFPIITVLGYGQYAQWSMNQRARKSRRNTMKFKVILASVKTDITDTVVDAAKTAGATGATIIPARGTGMREAKTFFGLSLEAPTDIIMFVLEEHIVRQVLAAISCRRQIRQAGHGDCLCPAGGIRGRPGKSAGTVQSKRCGSSIFRVFQHLRPTGRPRQP
jgi:nitrogen regulatory protein P-II 1